MVFAQETIIKGKITDANSGDPIPFAYVIFPGTTIGATTDFDGNFTIKTSNAGDTLMVSYVGYRSKKKSIVKGTTQTVNFQLEEDAVNLQEIVVFAGENPAYPIMRQVVKRKSDHDKRQLTA